MQFYVNLTFLEMAAIDTIKLRMPDEVARPNVGEFTRHEVNTKTGLMAFSTGTDVFGLNQISCKSGTTTLMMSAKILGANYRKGIQLDTLDQVIDTVNKTGLLNIRKADILEQAQVHEVHPSITMDLSESPKEVLKSIQFLNLQKRHTFTPYDNGGIRISPNAKSRTDNLIFYGKLRELNTQHNKLFLHQNPKVIEAFNSNSMRCELHLRKLNAIRKTFGTADVSLNHIMKAQKNPLEAVWKPFYDDFMKVHRNVMTLAKNITQAEKWAFIEACNNDLDQVMNRARQYSTGNDSRLKRAYRLQLHAKRMAEQALSERHKNRKLYLLDEIDEHIKEAV